MSRDVKGPTTDERPLPDEGIWVLIADYVSGRATAEQRATVEARQRTDPDYADHVRGAQLAWQHAVPPHGRAASTADTERAWARLVAELAAEADPGTPTIPLPQDRVLRLRPRARWRTAALAATIVTALGIGITLSTDRSTSDVAAGEMMREIVALPGQRIAVTLADGGRVILAPGSRLIAPTRFDGDVRQVTLHGRAYFEVAHDPVRPFLVETDAVLVRVLGTEFDLRAFAAAASAEIVVRSGRVAIRSQPDRAAPAAPASSDADDRVLTGGDRAVVDAAGGFTVHEGVDVDALLSWTTGRLVFERVALADVVADLERWYDVTIAVADPALASRRLTAAFDREPLDTVLETVGKLVDARVQRDGQHIVLSPS